MNVVLREGYLDGLEKDLEQNFKSSHKDIIAQRIALERKVAQTDQDLTRLIKLQMQTDDEDLRDLYSGQLKEMKETRKSDKETIEVMKDAEASVVDPVEFRGTIEFNLKNLQRAWDKATPSLRKKLLRAVVSRLAFRPDGIDIHYHSVQAEVLTVQSNHQSESTGAEPVDLASFKKFKEKQKADLSLMSPGRGHNEKFEKYFIVGIGCGGRI